MDIIANVEYREGNEKWQQAYRFYWFNAKVDQEEVMKRVLEKLEKAGVPKVEKGTKLILH